MTRILPAAFLLAHILAPVSPAQTGIVPCSPPTAPGVVCLQGAISGVLQTGTVYHVFTGSAVPPGMTLTVQPGAIVKFVGGPLSGLVVNGFIDVGLGAFLTSVKDDTVGGDSNGDGNATTPGPGDWFGLTLNLNDSSTINGATIRYATRAVALNQADISIADTVIEFTQGAALDLMGNSFPTVTRSRFDMNGSAVTGVPLYAVPGFTINTSTGNTVRDQMVITTSATPPSGPGAYLIERRNMIGGGFIFCGTPTVPAGYTLTIGPSILIKMSSECLSGNQQWVVTGTLHLQNINVTSIHDDTLGGDWNRNGNATMPAVGDWPGFIFWPGSQASTLRFVQLAWQATAVRLQGVGILMEDCVFEDGGGCLDIPASFPTVTRCIIRRNQGIAVINADPSAIPGFTDNQAFQNGGDYIRVVLQTLNGNVTWRANNAIASDGVFVLSERVTVGAGATLTLQTGVILKCMGPAGLSVAGTLFAQGAAGPIAITSFLDDTIGGDTNKDGNATQPFPGSWQNVSFGANADASRLENVLLRYAGGAAPADATLFLLDADITLRDVIVERGAGTALDLRHVSRPVVDRCIFRNNPFAVDLVPLVAVPGFTDCTATDNPLGNYLRITSGTVSQPTTIGPDNTLNSDGVLVLTTTVGVSAGVRLDLLGGVIFKFIPIQNLSVSVTGTLQCGSTGGFPVVFTSFFDDLFGGDTNLDGNATAGAPGHWRQVFFGAGSDASHLQNTIVRFAGQNGRPALELLLADITLQRVTVRDCAESAMDLRGSQRSFPVVQDCVFLNNRFAVDNVALVALPGFSGNTASMNLLGDYQRITDGSVSVPLLLRKEQSLNQGPFVLRTSVTVDPTGVLTVNGGSLMKFDGAFGVVVNGTLLVQGTPGVPAVFTSLPDDSVGGDTNKDGNATVPMPGDWFNVNFGGQSDASVVVGAWFRHGGRGSFGVLDLNGADVIITDTVVERSAWTAVDLSGNSRPQLRRLRLEDGPRYALDGAPLDAVAGFQDNLASGHALGNAVRITTATWTGPALVQKFNANNNDGVFVLATSVTVDAGDTLTLRQGTIFKWEGLSRILTNNHALNVEGTGREPVVFTSIDDDEVGGDTNRNGNATLPLPGQWQQVRINASAVASRIEHLLLRYGGSGGGAAFSSGNALASARSVRSDFSSTDGIDVTAHAGPAVNWVAWRSGGRGIDLQGGTFDLVHATAAASGGIGINGGASHTGSVVNAISFANTGGNFAGFTLAEVRNSNGDPGFAGQNGNILSDPLFEDLVAGRLGLQAGSPSLNTGDLATALPAAKDHVEASRILDHDLTGIALPDMGAFERANYGMAVGGEPRIATLMTFTPTGGPPGVAIFVLGFLDGTAPLLPYGIFGAGLFPTLVILGVGTTGTPFPLPIPDEPLLDGFPFGLQAAVVSAANPAVGNIVQLYRGRIFR